MITRLRFSPITNHAVPRKTAYSTDLNLSQTVMYKIKHVFNFTNYSTFITFNAPLTKNKQKGGKPRDESVIRRRRSTNSPRIHQKKEKRGKNTRVNSPAERRSLDNKRNMPHRPPRTPMDRKIRSSRRSERKNKNNGLRTTINPSFYLSRLNTPSTIL